MRMDLSLDEIINTNKHGRNFQNSTRRRHIAMDLSLDEIIKKKGSGRNSYNSRGRQRNDGVRTSFQQNRGGNRNNSTNYSGRVNKPGGRVGGGGNIVDLRHLIIKKNRMHITDARDKLADFARLTTDLRTKIKGANTNWTGRQHPGYHEHAPLPRQRGLPPRTHQRGRTPPVVLQRSISNKIARRADNFKGRVDNLMRRTINQNIPDIEEDDDDMTISEAAYSNLCNVKFVAQNNFPRYTPSFVQNDPEPMFVDYEPYTRGQPIEPLRQAVTSLSRSGARMSQQMRARLDTPPKSSHFSYTPSQPSQPPLSQQGYRIVVSNLHSTVTHEDVKELFEDIGPLLKSHLVRPGTAEVIYKSQRDAKKAVEVYHNRQLDKQPMKCLLVNSSSSSSSLNQSSGVLRSNNMPAPPKFPTSSKTNVIPDISAIHKALFMNRS